MQSFEIARHRLVGPGLGPWHAWIAPLNAVVRSYHLIFFQRNCLVVIFDLGQVLLLDLVDTLFFWLGWKSCIIHFLTGFLCR